jgi:hypothetical protein
VGSPEWSEDERSEDERNGGLPTAAASVSPTVWSNSPRSIEIVQQRVLGRPEPRSSILGHPGASLVGDSSPNGPSELHSGRAWGGSPRLADDTHVPSHDIACPGTWVTLGWSFCRARGTIVLDLSCKAPRRMGPR